MAAWAASSWRRCSGAACPSAPWCGAKTRAEARSTASAEFSRKRYLGAARPVFMLRVVSRFVRPEFLVVIEIVAAKA